MTIALLIIGNLVIWPVVLAALFGRIRWRRASGILALSCAPLVAAFALDGAQSVASAFAALGAVNGWLWWHGGGGDGTRRRLKSWARRFQGVRRAAPAAAS